MHAAIYPVGGYHDTSPPLIRYEDRNFGHSGGCSETTRPPLTCSSRNEADPSPEPAFGASYRVPVSRPASHSRCIHTCCAMPAATSSPTTAWTPERCSIIWATATSSTPRTTPSYLHSASINSGQTDSGGANSRTSAFPESGRSDRQKLGEIRVRFRPTAVIYSFKNGVSRCYLTLGLRFSSSNLKTDSIRFCTSRISPE